MLEMKAERLQSADSCLMERTENSVKIPVVENEELA